MYLTILLSQLMSKVSVSGDITLKYSDSTESKLQLLANNISCDQQVKDTLQQTQIGENINYKGKWNAEMGFLECLPFPFSLIIKES